MKTAVLAASVATAAAMAGCGGAQPAATAAPGRAAPVTAAMPECGGMRPREPPVAVDPAMSPVAFLAGAWSGARDGEVIEERWGLPAGGTMLATGRTLRGGKTAFFEYLRVELTASGLVYVAQPLGKEGTAFALRHAGEGEVVFENPAHDFPQRIGYKRRQDGGLDVQIEGVRGGQAARDAWVLRPVD